MILIILVRFYATMLKYGCMVAYESESVNMIFLKKKHRFVMNLCSYDTLPSASPAFHRSSLALC